MGALEIRRNADAGWKWSRSFLIDDGIFITILKLAGPSTIFLLWYQKIVLFLLFCNEERL